LALVTFDSFVRSFGQLSVVAFACTSEFNFKQQLRLTSFLISADLTAIAPAVTAETSAQKAAFAVFEQGVSLRCCFYAHALMILLLQR
jgi:hypothetical protein